MKSANLKVAATNEVKIEKGIPQPRVRANAKYPFHQMEVGDSFLFPAGYKEAHYYGMARDFTRNCILAGKAKKFIARKTPDGFRCWRVE